MIPEVVVELGWYHWVYISLHFIKEDGIYNRGGQVFIGPDTDKEEIKDVVLDDERDHHWRMVFEDNNVGVYGKKALIHEKRWGVYNS